MITNVDAAQNIYLLHVNKSGPYQVFWFFFAYPCESHHTKVVVNASEGAYYATFQRCIETKVHCFVQFFFRHKIETS